jgi:hypothetical protein
MGQPLLGVEKNYTTLILSIYLRIKALSNLVNNLIIISNRKVVLYKNYFCSNYGRCSFKNIDC